MTKRVAFYLRVSTDGQTTENQRRDLQEVAGRAGWSVVEVIEDAGISGSKGRDKRPGLDQLLRLVTQRKVGMVAAWSVDRLGRSLQDLVGVLNELREAGCDLYLHKQAIDTTTSTGRAMFGMLGVFAEFEREMIRDRVNAGLARAKAQGKTLGRPKTDDATIERIRAMRAGGMGMVRIARTIGCGVSVVQRVVAAEAA